MDNIKKFEDFLDRMQGLLDNAKKQGHIIVRVEELVKKWNPELKESEDEKIRNGIIKYLSYIKDRDGSYMPNNIPFDDMIAWLEKQGEQKSTLLKWKYKKDRTPLLRDSIILNKYGCVAKSPSGALVSDVWVIDYDELSKLPKEEIEKQGEQKVGCTTLVETITIPESKIVVNENKEWNEEDNKWIESLIQTFEDEYLEGFNQLKSYGVINWLKSLKERINEKQ